MQQPARIALLPACTAGLKATMTEEMTAILPYPCIWAAYSTVIVPSITSLFQQKMTLKRNRLVRGYLKKMNALSRAQTTRLIAMQMREDDAPEPA
jgi:hypothetical protein